MFTLTSYYISIELFQKRWGPQSETFICQKANENQIARYKIDLKGTI